VLEFPLVLPETLPTCLELDCVHVQSAMDAWVQLSLVGHGADPDSSFQEFRLTESGMPSDGPLTPTYGSGSSQVTCEHGTPVTQPAPEPTEALVLIAGVEVLKETQTQTGGVDCDGGVSQPLWAAHYTWRAGGVAFRLNYAHRPDAGVGLTEGDLEAFIAALITAATS